MNTPEMNQIQQRIKFMRNWVWDGVEDIDVQQFLSNFRDNDIVGKTLLDILIFYNLKQEEHIVENLLRLFVRDLWKNHMVGSADEPSCNILSGLKELKKQMYFVPLKVDGVSDSANSITSLYKKSSFFSEESNFVDVEDIPIMVALNKKIFIIYDDIIGTGTQFQKFWNKGRYTSKQNISLHDIAINNPNAKFYYLALAGYNNSINNLSATYPNVKFIVSEIFTETDSIFNDNNEYWELYPKNKKLIIDYIKSIQDQKGLSNDFSLMLPVLFQHDRANNTALPLYWSKKSDWDPFYRR